MPKNTIQRRLVMEAVQALHNHPCAEEIYAHICKSHPGISKATVYRNLGQLAERGEILRVSHLDAADRFDFNTGPHYHFRCRSCGAVFDVETDYQAGLLNGLKNLDGFVYETHDIVFTGLCPDCNATGSPKRTMHGKQS
ncbi:transcriptional repressor [Ruminococcaceae bacterium OttesenSCG-928-D13]|nr:transcriptional repressor [Ruminococcaceae bacterium OttesenSCG-928-D13]